MTNLPRLASPLARAVPLALTTLLALAACGDNIVPGGNETDDSTDADADPGSGSGSGSDTGVTALAVSEPNLTLPVGFSHVLHVTAQYADGEQRDVTAEASWSSDAPALATFDGGVVQTYAPGATVGHVELGSIRADITLAITSAAPLSIEIAADSPQVPLGHREPIRAYAHLSDGTTVDASDAVTWTVTPAAIATVDDENQLVATQKGVGSVHAELDSLGADAAIQITDAVVDRIELHPAHLEMGAHTSIQVTATGIYSDGVARNVTADVAWSTDNMNVATVVEGRVTSKAAGSAGITATSGAIAATARVDVSASPLGGIEIIDPTPTTPGLNLPVGIPLPLEAVATYLDGTVQDVTDTAVWVSLDPQVVSVTGGMGNAGLLVGVAPGTATVQVTLGGFTAQVVVTVTAARLQTLSIGSATGTCAATPSTLVLATGIGARATATGHFDDGTTLDLTGAVRWSSTAPSVVAVTDVRTHGHLLGGAAGSAVLHAQLGVVIGEAPISTSSAIVAALAIEAGSGSFALAGAASLHARATLSDGATCDATESALWSSSLTAVVALSNADVARGELLGLGNGVALVTAKQESIAASVRVDIGAENLQRIDITPTPLVIATGGAVLTHATGVYTDGVQADLTARVVWGSSQPSIASFLAGQAGMLVGHALGVSTITASLAATHASAVATVTGL